jgi:polyhydroxybutyrate depolymerase
MHRHFASIAFFGFHMMMAAGSAEPSILNAKDSPSEWGQAGWHESSLRIGTLERWFRVYIPENLPHPARLVLLLHGGTQSMRKIFRPGTGATAGWLDIADREKFILVAPNGVNTRTGNTKGDFQNWNDIRPADANRHSKAADVGFIRDLLNWLARTYDVDSTRRYVTGASNGGMMTYRLLLELPGTFAAGAAFIATMPEVNPLLKVRVTPTPLFICNGTKDPLVRWEGGWSRLLGTMKSTGATVAWWVDENKADRNRAETTVIAGSGDHGECKVTKTFYPPSEEGAPLVFCKVEGGGHSLPSKRYSMPNGFFIRRLLGPQCRDVEGIELAWDFMKNYTRQ